MGGELKGSLEVEEVEVEGVEGGGVLTQWRDRIPPLSRCWVSSCTKQMGALSPQCRSDALEREGSSRFDTETALRYY